mmetsp:Transcript_43659/g.113795  ORF Transcript_43659/g.113795 Transcript_43659/m.113795 type:complete len:744 (+) Transcript_43659:150-2381(+)
MLIAPRSVSRSNERPHTSTGRVNGRPSSRAYSARTSPPSSAFAFILAQTAPDRQKPRQPQSPQTTRPARRPRRPFSSKPRAEQAWRDGGEEGDARFMPRPQTSMDNTDRGGPSQLGEREGERKDGGEGLHLDLHTHPSTKNEDKKNGMHYTSDDGGVEGVFEIESVGDSPLRNARDSALSHLGTLPQGSAGVGFLRQRRPDGGGEGGGGGGGGMVDVARIRRKDVEMEQMVRRLLADIETLREEMKQMEAKKTKIEEMRKQERSSLVGELEATLQQLAQSQQNWRLALKEKEVVEVELNAMKDAKASHSDTSSTRVGALEEQVAQLEDRLKARDAEISVMRPKLVEIASKKEAAARAAGDAVAEVRKALELELNTTLRALKDEKEKVSRLEEVVKGAKERMEVAEDARSGLKQEIAILKDGLEKKEDTISEMRYTIGHKTKEVEKLAAEMKSQSDRLRLAEEAKGDAYLMWKKEMQDVMGKVAADQKSMSEVQRENVILKAEVDRLRQKMKEEEERAAEKMEEMKEEMEVAKKVVDVEKERSAAHSRQVVDAQQKHAKTAAELEVTKVEMKALRGEIQRVVEEELQRVKMESEKRRRKGEEEEQKRMEAEKEVAMLRRRIEEVELLERDEKVAAAVAAVREEMKAEVIESRRKLRVAEEKNIHLSEIVAKVSRERDEASVKKDELAAALAETSSMMESGTNNKLARLEAEKKAAEEKAESLKGEVEVLQMEVEKGREREERLK